MPKLGATTLEIPDLQAVPHSDWRGLSYESIDLRLCTLCGTCISACPVGALVWQGDDTIAFSRESCVDCGLSCC